MIIDKDNIKILLFILVLGLGIGYAYINSDLNINGTAQVNSANWDVHWANIQVTTGSVTGSNVVTQPTISNNTTVNYSIILSNPGDYYEFTVDAVNAGSIDAMIDTIDSKLNGATITTLPAYLKYSVTYADGAELESNQELKSNSIETYKVRIEYNDDINANQLPATNQTLSLQFTVTYRQATTASKPVNHETTVYTVSSTSSYIGQAMPNSITQYSSGAEAMAAFSNRPFYLRHLIRNGIIEESYVEFVVTSAMAQENSGMTAGTYVLRGFVTYDVNASSTNYCKAEYYNSSTGLCTHPYYESNKQVLQTAFGSSNCTEDTEIGYKDYSCDVSSFAAGAKSNGYVGASLYGVFHCNVFYVGRSYCGAI